MGSTTTSHCWRGRSTSIYANLPLDESSEHMFDFVFGDQTFPSNISTRESMPVVVDRLPRKEVCGGGRGDVVCNPESSWRSSTTSTMSVSSSHPQAKSVDAEIDNVVGKPQSDISIFATPLPEFVLEQRQRKLSKESNGSTPTPTCTIIEEGREWYGYRDEGIRQAAQMFGVTGPWIRPSCGSEDVDADKSKGIEEGVKRGVKKEKPFWHGNGRKVGVQERWVCVGDDEFGIGEELVVVGEDVEERSVDSANGIPERSRYSEERPWWNVRWRKVFTKLGCGVRA